MNSNVNSDLLLKGGLLPSGAVADILIRDGNIAGIADSISTPPDAQIIDVAGKLVSPGLVNGHVHLDKTLLGAAWIPHLPAIR